MCRAAVGGGLGGGDGDGDAAHVWRERERATVAAATAAPRREREGDSSCGDGGGGGGNGGLGAASAATRVPPMIGVATNPEAPNQALTTSPQVLERGWRRARTQTFDRAATAWVNSLVQAIDLQLQPFGRRRGKLFAKKPAHAVRCRRGHRRTGSNTCMGPLKCCAP